MLLILCIVALLTGAIGSVTYWNSLFDDMPVMPEKAELWSIGRVPSIEILDSEGNRLAHRGPKYGVAVSPETLPEHILQAFIAGEDKNFYTHQGVDVGALMRAASANWKAGRTVQGGSTLTQQLVKNLLLTPEQSLKRKAQEMSLSLELERRLTKDEILALYLNRIYLGNSAYGIDGAAEVYFGKHAADLNLSEATFIAALPKAPSRMSQDPELSDARRRQRYVLSKMVDQGFITLDEAQAAAAEPIVFVEEKPDHPLIGYVADYVTTQMYNLLPDAPKDAVVTITLNTELQEIAHKSLKTVLDRDGKRGRIGNGAVVLMDTNGQVLAMIGGTDYETSKFNRVTQAMRQPGSSFKPFVYATAMEKGLTPDTVRVDERTYITSTWAPRNYTGQYYGPVTLRDALANSLNTVAAKLTKEVGAKNVVDMAHRLGLGTELKPFPSIALGSDETTLFDMVRAYGAFARSGKRLDPYIIESIHNTRGDLIYSRKPYPSAKVLEPGVARDMNEMLQRVITHGSGGRAKIDGWVIAGKTGTSQSWRDAWFIGYTSNVIAGVWMGNDNNKPMARITGGSMPAQVWHDMMTLVLKDYTPAQAEGVAPDQNLTDDQVDRVAFYSDLAAAFQSAQPTRVAGLDPTAKAQ